MGTFSVRAWRDGLLGAAGEVFGEKDFTDLIEGLPCFARSKFFAWVLIFSMKRVE
jgi:hypothetical protein